MRDKALMLVGPALVPLVGAGLFGVLKSKGFLPQAISDFYRDHLILIAAFLIVTTPPPTVRYLRNAK